MMSKIQLLALDLDGTTLTDDKRITENTKNWIQKAVKSGVTVIFATGRGYPTAIDYWKDLKLTGPMVFTNGAEVWAGPEKILERHFIRKEDIEWIYEIANDAGAHFWGYSEDRLVHKKDWTDECFNEQWLKFGISHKDIRIIENLRDILRKRKTITITNSMPNNIEVSYTGISKKTGVETVCQLLGISLDQVMAIGDGQNDKALIEAAGLGVAMENADEDLKKVADVITDTNEADGVAKAIEKYIFRKG